MKPNPCQLFSVVMSKAQSEIKVSVCFCRNLDNTHELRLMLFLNQLVQILILDCNPTGGKNSLVYQLFIQEDDIYLIVSLTNSAYICWSTYSILKVVFYLYLNNNNQIVFRYHLFQTKKSSCPQKITKKFLQHKVIILATCWKGTEKFILFQIPTTLYYSFNVPLHWNMLQHIKSTV